MQFYWVCGYLFKFSQVKMFVQKQAMLILDFKQACFLRKIETNDVLSEATIFRNAEFVKKEEVVPLINSATYEGQ